MAQGRTLLNYRIDDEGYWRIIGPTGETHSTIGPTPGLVNTPWQSNYVWGETGQNLGRWENVSTTREILYAGTDYFLTKDRGRLIRLYPTE